MGVGKPDALSRESIDVGRLGLGVSVVASNPVIQVVDGNEQHVRWLRREYRRVAGNQTQRENKQVSHDGWNATLVPFFKSSHGSFRQKRAHFDPPLAHHDAPIG